jgi:hypothetical protein
MYYAIVAIIALALMCYGIELFQNRHPLTAEEVIQLAQKRRRIRALFEYRFGSQQRLADPAEKKAMNSNGEFVALDIDFSHAPARIAGLLKYKKHEWIVFAFVRRKRVTNLWWNKGPDGTQVWLFLEEDTLEKTIQSLKPDAIAIFHNHPSSRKPVGRDTDFLTRALMSVARDLDQFPSRADLETADSFQQHFASRHISLLDFICVRGIPHLYHAAFSDDVFPVQPIIDEIDSMNGTGIFGNCSLRRELKRRTRTDHIHGAPLTSAESNAA